MTIGILHLGRTGAGPQLTLELTRALIALGEPVALVYSAQAEIAHELEDLPCAKLAVRTFSGPAGAIFGLTRVPAINRSIDRFFTQHGADTVVVTMEQLWQGFLTGGIGRGRNLLLAIHDATAHPGEQGRIAGASRYLQRRGADAALVFSEHVGEAVRRAGTFRADRIYRTVHPAFDLPHVPRPRSLPADRTPVVGFFGRMSRYKGLDLGVATMTELLNRGRDVRLHVAGNGIPLDVPSIIRPEITLEDRWIPQSEVVDVIDSFDIMLLPYTEASQSGVLAYAMALGIPAVATPVGGLIEQAIDSECALVSSEVNAAALADTIEHLLDHPSEYVHLSAPGIATASTRYSWSRTARDVRAAVRALENRKSSDADPS